MRHLLIPKTPRVFISYPNELHETADDLAQALRNDGYVVFHDKSTLVAGEDYNNRIRLELKNSEYMIVLLTQKSIKPPSYVLAELEIARDIWPSAKGRLLPVLIDGSIDLTKLPSYVRSVHIYRLVGNPVAEILHQLAKVRGQRLHHSKAATAFVSLGVSALAIFALLYWTQVSFPSNARIDVVHFRPLSKPAVGASGDDAWQRSQLTITAAPLTYALAWLPATRNQVLRERASLEAGDAKISFDWLYEVDLKPNCAEWTCRLRNAEPLSLSRSEPTSREVMFTAPIADYDWQSFMSQILNQKLERLTVQIHSDIMSTLGPFRWQGKLVSTCAVSLRPYREKMLKMGYSQAGRLPPFFQPTCDDVGRGT